MSCSAACTTSVACCFPSFLHCGLWCVLSCVEQRKRQGMHPALRCAVQNARWRGWRRGGRHAGCHQPGGGAEVLLCRDSDGHFPVMPIKPYESSKTHTAPGCLAPLSACPWHVTCCLQPAAALGAGQSSAGRPRATLADPPRPPPRLQLSPNLRRFQLGGRRREQPGILGRLLPPCSTAPAQLLCRAPAGGGRRRRQLQGRRSCCWRPWWGGC